MKRIFMGYTAGKAQGVTFQCQVIKFIAGIAAPIVILFSGINFFNDDTTLALIEIIVSGLFAYCALAPCNGKTLLIRSYLLLSLVIFIMFTVFIDGGLAKGGSGWSLFFPFLAAMLMGLPRAWYWIIGYACLLIVAITLHFHNYYILPYENDYLLYFFCLYIASSLFASGLEAQFEKLHVRYEGTIEELNRLRENLEQHVQERTGALQKANVQLKEEVEKHKETALFLKESEQRFFQAQKMETMGTLVGGIAHDFNNMLAGINANLFMIKRKTKEDKDIQKRTVDIERLVMRASDMVKQLLTFARKDHVELVSFDMVLFMKEAFKLAEVSISDKIQMRLENYEQPLLVRANATQLQQVLMNMVNNARDAMKGMETPSIIVKVEKYFPSTRFKQYNPDLTAASYATFTVIDNGQGIAPEQVDKIFEPFYTTKEVGKGTGLGLAMCFGAIQSHGGKIQVQSEVGKGTAFKVFIPIDDTVTAEKHFDDSGTVSVGLGEMILLVDDDVTLLKSQKHALTALGYEVLEAKHGKQAVQLFEQYQSQISLVVTDVTMPVMGGVRAVQKMRAIQGDLRVIFVTGYDKDNTLDELPSMDECILEKPYTMDKLNKMIQQQLR
ncbi:hybrid sensor histidine kinase/response regulator [Ghiorsea bivora]|uniref:hybrid sensor histidine kinase/response regulator n=1 Tax=Ghiorsea bivora TaxID=1485545 RepID=UPI0009DE7333|nr:ATP-binding protein [Ghiorsea bivora]